MPDTLERTTFKIQEVREILVEVFAGKEPGTPECMALRDFVNINSPARYENSESESIFRTYFKAIKEAELSRTPGYAEAFSQADLIYKQLATLFTSQYEMEIYPEHISQEPQALKVGATRALEFLKQFSDSLIYGEKSS